MRGAFRWLSFIYHLGFPACLGIADSCRSYIFLFILVFKIPLNDLIQKFWIHFNDWIIFQLSKIGITVKPRFSMGVLFWVDIFFEVYFG